MARFDVYRSKDEGVRFLLDCQADVLGDFDTRFVVPLYRTEGARAASRLHPVFDVGDERVLMVTQLASAVPLRSLGPKVASLADKQPAIIDALDMLIAGY